MQSDVADVYVGKKVRSRLGAELEYPPSYVAFLNGERGCFTERWDKTRDNPVARARRTGRELGRFLQAQGFKQCRIVNGKRVRGIEPRMREVISCAQMDEAFVACVVEALQAVGCKVVGIQAES